MVKQTCDWQGCKTIIKVDTSANCSFFSVGGWCKKHHKQYAKERREEK